MKHFFSKIPPLVLYSLPLASGALPIEDHGLDKTDDIGRGDGHGRAQGRRGQNQACAARGQTSVGMAGACMGRLRHPEVTT